MSEAITNAEFSSLLKNHSFVFETKPSVAISFSCGSDSLALLILMNNWIKKHKGFLTLICVICALNIKNAIPSEANSVILL